METNRFGIEPCILNAPSGSVIIVIANIDAVHVDEETKSIIGGNPKPAGRLVIFRRIEQSVEVNTD
jgi:hypothetical protein